MQKAVMYWAFMAVCCAPNTGCVYAKTADKQAVSIEEIANKDSSLAVDAEESAEELSNRIKAVLDSNKGAAYSREAIEGESTAFKEVWAFYTSFYKADENRIADNAEVTDIALFGAEIGSYGDLEDIPSLSRAKKAKADFNGRVHLTFACNSRGVTHFCLDPKYDIRLPLLNAIALAARGFDGVVCDLEVIPAKDKDNYISFLESLKTKLGKRMLTVCVPARTKPLSKDTFPYREISAIADRVFVMAYDEHWSTSKPGPVASYEWCQKIADYAVSIVPKEKLIMGIPFYARAWVDSTKNPVGAWRYSKFNKHLAENGVSEIERTANGDAHVKYSVTVDVDAYFDDAYSLHKKCTMYAAKGIELMGVWCIGQDDREFWKWIKVGDRE